MMALQSYYEIILQEYCFLRLFLNVGPEFQKSQIQLLRKTFIEN